MNRAELLADLERRATEAEAMNTRAPVKDVIRTLIQEVRELDETPTRTAKDRHISVAEAADRIGMSKRWIYAHAGTLPFVRKNGGRSVRCSERDLERYMKLNLR